jgi:hypothetical protein
VAPPALSASCLALLVAVVCGGCGGPSYDGRVYRGEGFAFQLPPAPPQWKRVSHSHAALAFVNERHEATMMFNGRCGVGGDDVPLIALTKHLFLQFTERDVHSQEVVPFDDREAMRTLMTAKLDGVELKYDAWVLKKDGCVYDLLYFAPPAGFEPEHDTFLQLVRDFSTVASDGA